MNSPVLRLENIHKTYTLADQSVSVLKGVSLTLPEGKCYAMLGQSGSGKSTLLHIAGLLDRSYQGDVEISGVSIRALSESKRVALIREKLGFVFQFNNLLPEFSAIENVMIPLLIRGMDVVLAKIEAVTILESVGLGHRLDHKPSRLSGGEQQRVAIARALITKPALLLADEPTGNLDSETSDVIFTLLMERAKHLGTTILLVTHNLDLAKRTDAILHLKDGLIVKTEYL